MSTKKYGYVIDSVSGEIQTPDIFSCKYGSLSTLYKIGNISDLRIKVSLGNAFECSFSVYKDTDNESDDNFDNFSDMNAVYIDGFDYFDIKIDLEESSDTVKKVTGKSLSYSELSNGTKVSMEVNTEDDIARKNYDSDFPTLFYRNIDDYSAKEKEAAEKSSFLHRLLTFAPHYKIGHVDETLWGQYRTFSWNNQDFISVLSDVEQEIKCVFHLEIKKDKNGVVNRYIHAYDLEYCEDCYKKFLNDGKTDYRNVSNGKCNNDHSHKIFTYGENTDIFISTENLTDSITLSSNKDSIKNMFKVRGGDDIINDALKNINFSGDRIICFSNRMLDSMEDDLKEKVILYQDTVKSYEEESKKVMNYIYNLYDLILYLESGKVPYHEKENKRLLEEECSFIAQELLKENAVSSQDPSKLTVVSSKNIVKSVSGFYTGIGYTTKTSCVTYNKSNFKWIGTITVTDSDDPNQYGIIHFNENDTSVELYGYDSLGNPSTSPIKTLNFSSTLFFSDDFPTYVDYKMQLASQQYDIGQDDILMSDADFNKKINQSGLNKLNAYYAAFSAVMEVLQGISNIPLDEYCNEKYDLCFKRCHILEEKMSILQEQIDLLNNILNGSEVKFIHYSGKTVKEVLNQIKDTIDVRDDDDNILVYYDQTQKITYSSLMDIIIEGYTIYGDTCFLKRKSEIADATNIEYILGNLYPLFCSYIKEDIYENQNYVSDGLNNAEIIENARLLLEAAKREIKSACELQYTISAPLSCIISYISQNQNGITIEDIYDKFLLGNFVHFKIDDTIFKLRVSSIDFDYNSIDKITVEFTDVNMESNHTTDSINGLLTTMSSIASSYNYTANQAEKSYQTYKEVNTVKQEGLDAAQIQINSGMNQSVVHDDKGILIRQYDEENELYLPQQMRLNNGNIVLTNDNWKSLQMAIGKGRYNEKTVYGVWADVLVGDLMITDELHVQNNNQSVIINENGITLDGGVITWKQKLPLESVEGLNEASPITI